MKSGGTASGGRNPEAPMPDGSPNPGGRPAIIGSAITFLRDFLAYVEPALLRGLVLVGLGALLENVGIVLLIPLVGLTAHEGLPQGTIETVVAQVFDAVDAKTRLAQMSVLMVLFAALLLARGLVQSRRNRLLSRWRIGFVQLLRLRVLRGLGAANWQQIHDLRHARISHVLSGDVDRVGAAAYAGLDGLVALIMLASQMLLALLLAPVFAAAALAVCGLAMLGLGSTIRQSYILGNQLTQRHLSLTHSLGQLLGGLKLAMSQNLQSTFVAEFETGLADLAHQQVAFINQQTGGQLAVSTISVLAASACASVGIGVLDMPVALVVPLLLVFSRMSGPAMNILRNVQQVMHGLPAYERLCSLERALKRDHPAAKTRVSPEIMLADTPVVFDNVTFSHKPGSRRQGEETAGVSHVSLTIPPGEILGVSGPSGSGKTTFADLLVGLNQPQQGTISAGGMVLGEAVLTQWQRQLSYVSQDAFLFHDSLRRNLLWGQPDASEADIWKALAVAEADGFVRSLKLGLDSIAGERGTLVSGGERQRLALARALLRRPRLLVLDEATSALDVATERRVLENIARLMPPPTIVVIAHRAESLALCTRIVTFQEGGLKLAGCQPGIGA